MLSLPVSFFSVFQAWRNPSSQMMCRRGAILPPPNDSRWLLLLLSPLLSASVAQWSGLVQAAGLEGYPGAFIRAGSTVARDSYGVYCAERVGSRRRLSAPLLCGRGSHVR